MAKAFDILPPYSQKKAEHHSHKVKHEKEKAKSQHALIIFIMGVIFITALFLFIRIEENPITVTNTPQTTNDNSNQFELFNDSGNSTLTDREGIVTVRITGSDTTKLSETKELLLQAGYRIEKTVKSEELSEETVIYYKKGQLTLAQKIAESLQKFSPTLREQINLESSYDLLISIGNS